MVRDLLRTNAGCDLPCWWGIIPGKTRWKAAKSILRSMGARVGSGSQPESDGTISHGTGGFDFERGPVEKHIYNSIDFDVLDGIIDAIHIWSDAGSNYTDFYNIYENYLPEQIMSKYGEPSRIIMQTTSSDEGDPGIIGYTLKLFFDDLGIAIRYNGRHAVIRAKTYRICPEFYGKDIGSIKMLLQAPDNPKPLDRIDDPTEWDMKSTLPIEKATGMSTQEFYQLFTQNDQPACFETPIDVWPALGDP